MMKLNWFECDLKCYDGLGMECSIVDVPFDIRRRIAGMIMKGHTCGSFGEEFIDEKKWKDFDESYVEEVREVAELHKDSVKPVENKEIEDVRLFD